MHDVCEGLHLLVLISVGCHLFAVLNLLLPVTAQGEVVGLSEILGFLDY